MERTLSRLMRSRRLDRDYERRPETGETFILWSMTMVMSRRLARHYSRAARTGRGDLSSPALTGVRSGPRERRVLRYGPALPDGAITRPGRTAACSSLRLPRCGGQCRADGRGNRSPGRGICLDTEGAVWEADVGNKHCVRVREGGQVLQTVDADRGCYACTLGGTDGRTLYIAAAQWPSDFRTPTGQVLAVDVTVPSAVPRPRGQ